MEVKTHAQDAHLLHARIGPVVLTQITPGHTDSTFELYLAALERELADRPRAERVAVIYHVPSGGTFSAVQRARINRVLERHFATRRATTTVWVLCTPSAATRGVVTALFWLSPPPYEFRTRATLDEALTDVREKHPDFDAGAFRRALASTVGKTQAASA